MKKSPKNGEKCQNLAIFDVAQKKAFKSNTILEVLMGLQS